MKRKTFLVVLASFMMFTLFNAGVGAEQAEDLPYKLTVSETLGQEKATVTLMDYDAWEEQDIEIEFTLVPAGASLSITPDIDFSAVMLIYAESDGVYWEEPAFWQVDGSMSGYNFVEANTTAEITFKDIPNIFYELSIWEEGYERSVYYKVQGGEEDASAQEPEEDDSAVEPEEDEEEVVTEAKAKPTSSSLQVNGEEIEFTAYNIAYNNYFKLRDLAMMVTGSEKQFEVTWDADANAIGLISDSEYTPVGGELEVVDQPKTVLVQPTASHIYKDGEEIELTAYLIAGNNYFKLRDIAELFNIGVIWDEETQTIAIDTSIDYIPE